MATGGSKMARGGSNRGSGGSKSTFLGGPEGLFQGRERGVCQFYWWGVMVKKGGGPPPFPGADGPGGGRGVHFLAYLEGLKHEYCTEVPLKG